MFGVGWSKATCKMPEKTGGVCRVGKRSVNPVECPPVWFGVDLANILREGGEVTDVSQNGRGRLIGAALGAASSGARILWREGRNG
jgi:hypothetical protein